MYMFAKNRVTASIRRITFYEKLNVSKAPFLIHIRYQALHDFAIRVHILNTLLHLVFLCIARQQKLQSRSYIV